MKTTTLSVKNEMKAYIGQRKHVSQMTPREVNGLWMRLRNVDKTDWTINDHSLDRIKQKGIKVTREDIISTIYHAQLKEYKVDTFRGQGDERVVLRSKAIVNGCYNIHAVYSLTSKRIVTVWMNHLDDQHATLDWSLYNADMKVFGV